MPRLAPERRMIKLNWTNIKRILTGQKVDLSDPHFDGCGISTLVYVEETHPFTPACNQHDTGYVLKELSRKQIDKRFFKNMLAIAGNSPALVSTAFLWFGIVRLFGGLVW